MRYPSTNLTGQKGYTLIELLLYVSIIGSLLTAVSMYFGTSTEARVKNQSIAEVNQQGALAMEHIVRTVRGADSITSPAAGVISNTLTLAVPTGALSPTIFSLNDGSGGAASVMGYNVDGTTTDSSNSDTINATKFVAATSGTVTALYARVGATIGASPDNKAKMAIYSGTTNPTTLLATSSENTLTASAWNIFPISPVAVTAGTTYWLAYNTNGAAAGQNNLRFHAGTSGQSRFVANTYENAWPSSWTGGTQNDEFSLYADVYPGTGTGSLQIKEGTAANVVLTNSKVQVSGLSFKNISRSGTPGAVEITFTVSRLNPSGKNEYSFQKTFTSTAALR